MWRFSLNRVVPLVLSSGHNKNVVSTDGEPNGCRFLRKGSKLLTQILIKECHAIFSNTNGHIQFRFLCSNPLLTENKCMLAEIQIHAGINISEVSNFYCVARQFYIFFHANDCTCLSPVAACFAGDNGTLRYLKGDGFF